MPIDEPPPVLGVVPPPQEFKPARSLVLLEAEGLINGDRNVTYGRPTQNFSDIGEFFTARLKHKLLPGEEITPVDVADLMVLLKIARNITVPKRDNYVDIAGYAGCGWECAEELEMKDVPF